MGNKNNIRRVVYPLRLTVNTATGSHHGVADLPAGANWAADPDLSVHPQDGLSKAD